MKKPIKNISLSFPCQENWNGMSPTENGRHCSSCNSCVVDFRNKSAEELENTLITASAPVCGRFNKSQLSTSFLKYAASAVIASSLAGTAIGQEPIPMDSIDQIEEIETDVIFGQIMETQPTPLLGGWKGFYERLSKEVKVPKYLEVKTRVFVEFKIDTSGNMTDITVVRGDDQKLNEEAIRALNTLSEKFEPGTQRGIPVIVKQILPIVFDPKKD